MPYRIASPSRRRGLYLLLVAGAVSGLVALGLTVGERLSSNQAGISANRAANQVVCVQVQKLENVIRAVLVQTLHTFGQRSTSGYAYYREHPAELAAGRVALRREIAQFSGHPC